MAEAMISPGVYSTIQSLSSYVNSVPGTIGFVPVITEKGKDNVLYRCTGTQDYLENFGEPDIRTFGKYYGCGPYIATQHLSVSNDLYVIRVLPDDAIYAHTYVYFAELKDFPTDKRFVELYKGYIYDPTKKVDMTLFEVDDSVFGGTDATAAQKNSKLEQLKSADETLRFFDEEMQDTDKADDVRYTNDPNYAAITDGTPYYNLDAEVLKTVTPAVTETKTYAAWAVEDTECTCYDSEGEVTTTVENVAYVSKAEYAATPEEKVSGQEYYIVKTGELTKEITPAVQKTYAELAVAEDKAYDYELVLTDDITKAVYTTKEEYAQKLNNKAQVVGFLVDGAVYKGEIRVQVLESITSNADNNVGSYRLQMGYYSGTHVGLSAFSVESDISYPISSDVTCFVQATKKVDLYTIKDDDTIKADAFARRVGYNSNGYLELGSADKVVYTSHLEFADPEDAIDGDNIAEAAVTDAIAPVWEIDPEPWYVLNKQKVLDAIDAHNAYDKNGFLTTNPAEAEYCADFQYAEISDGEYKKETLVALKSPVGQIPALQKFKRTVGNYIYVLDTTLPKVNPEEKIESIRKLCAECKAFDENGYPTMDWTKAVLTTDKTAAKTDVTPKMSNTQKLDALFYGNDTLISGVIDNLEGKAITSKVFPHEAVLCYIRAVGRGDYYNDYSVKITSDANPQNFGTYKFQVFELQDGVEALCESFNVSFDPTALDGDGESLYFVDVINKFSTRVVVEANPNAVALFRDQMKAFYENDPTITDVAADYTYEESVEGKIVEKYLLNKAFPAIPKYDSETGKVEARVVVYDKDGNIEYEDDGYTPKTTQVPGPEYGYKAQLVFEAYYAKAWAEKATHDSAEKYADALDKVNKGVDGADVDLGLAIDEMNLAQDMTATAAEIYNWAVSRNLMDLNDSDPLATGEQPYYLQNGSMGSLIDKTGKVNDQVGKQILSFAYTGLLKNPVFVKKTDESTGSVQYVQQYTDNLLDTDWIYFSIVYDPGYKPDVKQAALDLVDVYRRDCVLLSDCGDNANYEECLKYVGYIKGAKDARMWNTYLAARYEPYSRIYDKFTGKDIWVSPIYHMAQMIPQNDALYDIWYASAGFNRGTVASIKELRYSPNKAQRDQLYMAQVNPIVHFPEGMTVWGQLTTQKKADPLSDLNSVRTVLYIKRALEQYCRGFIFEFNDGTTWSAIQSECGDFLSQMQERGAIEGFNLDVGATDYELKTKVCHVNVTLIMRKTLEKIQLNFFVQ